MFQWTIFSHWSLLVSTICSFMPLPATTGTWDKDFTNRCARCNLWVFDAFDTFTIKAILALFQLQVKPQTRMSRTWFLFWSSTCSSWPWSRSLWSSSLSSWWEFLVIFIEIMVIGGVGQYLCVISSVRKRELANLWSHLIIIMMAAMLTTMAMMAIMTWMHHVCFDENFDHAFFGCFWWLHLGGNKVVGYCCSRLITCVCLKVKIRKHLLMPLNNKTTPKNGSWLWQCCQTLVQCGMLQLNNSSTQNKWIMWSQTLVQWGTLQ